MMVGKDDKNRTAPPLPQAAQARIGNKLRSLFNDIANEPVPDRFRQLLADLEQAQVKAGSQATARDPAADTPAASVQGARGPKA